MGKGEGEEEEWRNRGRRKVGKGTHQSCGPIVGKVGGSSWGEADEVRGGEVDLGEKGLASEGADKQEDKNGEEGEVSLAWVPHVRVGAAVGGM